MAKLEAGTKILITNGTLTHGYENGDILTVSSEYAPIGFVRAVGVPIIIDEDEFEVIEQPKLKTKKRPANVGERILIVDAMTVGGQTHKNGDILTVTGNAAVFERDVYVAEQPKFIDYNEYEVIIEEEPTGAPKPKYVPSNGDTVRVLKPGTALNLSVGDVGTVEEHSGKEGSRFRVMTKTASVINWVSADDVELVKAAEQSKPLATTPAVAVNVSIGDTVEVKKTGLGVRSVGWGKSGQGLVKVGSKGKVVNVNPDGSIEVKFPKSASDSASDSALERFFLRNGEYEKVDVAPFQPGDIVLVSDESYTGAFYGEVIDGPMGALGGGNYTIDNGKMKSIVLGKYLVMIAPKDNRVD
jgi:hypothetical protein